MYDTAQTVYIPGTHKVNYPTSYGHLFHAVSTGKSGLTGPSSKIGSRAYLVPFIRDLVLLAWGQGNGWSNRLRIRVRVGLL